LMTLIVLGLAGVLVIALAIVAVVVLLARD
jgi:hypothetical protein